MAQVPINESSLADEVTEDGVHRIAPDLAYIRTAIVNVVFYGTGRDWVLIDAGIVGSRVAIASAARVFSSVEGPPKAIVLTHGHFDHVGALEGLAAEWDVPIYAHPLEHPYLNGKAAYPDGIPQFLFRLAQTNLRRSQGGERRQYLLLARAQASAFIIQHAERSHGRRRGTVGRDRHARACAIGGPVEDRA